MCFFSQENVHTQNIAEREVYIDGLLHSYIMLWLLIIALYDWSNAALSFLT